MVLLNRSTTPHDITVDWSALNYPDDLKATVRDLWRHWDFGTRRRSFTANVEGHSVVMVTIGP
ncbi:MAG: hypothetical protein KGJ28_13005 [Alphaproteobacteria bacterium]|nr:hypothetical protein [Alphaproteobacteria bacterium]